MKVTKYISFLLILSQLFSFNSYAASQKRVSIVVVPVHDGRGDDQTDQAANELRSLLNSEPRLNVVDDKKVTDVLKYYDRPDDPKLTNVERLLSHAKESYYKLNYVEAKSVVKKAISSLKTMPGTLYDYGKILLDGYLTLGIISKSMGNIGEARQAFREALRLDPSYQLDSRAFSPSLINLFENVKSSLDIQPKGAVRVDSNPKVAEVYLNGVFKGVTPVTIEEVLEGENFLKISANKYETVRKKIDVVAGKKMRIKEKLSWAAGRRGSLDGKSYVRAEDGISQIEEGLKIADLMRVNKTVMIDADPSSGVISARMVDAKYRTGHKPVVVKSGAGDLSKLSKELASQTHINIAKNPEKYSEPVGKGEPVLLGSKGRKKISKPVLFGILGGAVAIGLGAGLAAAFAGGGGGGSGPGSVNVSFTNK